MSFHPNTPPQFSAGVGQEPQTPALAPNPHPAQILRYTLYRIGTKYRSGQDFQMPDMTGVDLAVKITAQRPEIKVLLMSGFTGGMLILNEGWHFLPKPFIPSQLRALLVGLLPPGQASRYSEPTLPTQNRS